MLVMLMIEEGDVQCIVGTIYET